MKLADLGLPNIRRVRWNWNRYFQRKNRRQWSGPDSSNKRFRSWLRTI